MSTVLSPRQTYRRRREDFGDIGNKYAKKSRVEK
jgi:hypothetical protein